MAQTLGKVAQSMQTLRENMTTLAADSTEIELFIRAWRQLQTDVAVGPEEPE